MDIGQYMVWYIFVIAFSLQSVKGNPRVNFRSANKDETFYSSSTTWAVNVPVLTLQHIVYTTARYPFALNYYLRLGNSSMKFLCSYTFQSSGCSQAGLNCIDCNDKLSSNKSIVANFSVTNLDLTKNESAVVYDFVPNSVSKEPIHQFTLTYCAQYANNAKAVDWSPDTCGYGCTSGYECLTGYVNRTVSTSSFTCGATAEWIPALPLCVLSPEPTTTETATTPTARTASNGSTQGGDGAVHPSSGPCLAGIGGGLAAVCIGIFVYMAIIGIDIPNKVSYYAMFALCLLVWAMALGLCFGVSTNEAAVVAGIVLGSLALAGMVVIIGFQIAIIKSHKD